MRLLRLHHNRLWGRTGGHNRRSRLHNHLWLRGRADHVGLADHDRAVVVVVVVMVEKAVMVMIVVMVVVVMTVVMMVAPAVRMRLNILNHHPQAIAARMADLHRLRFFRTQ